MGIRKLAVAVLTASALAVGALLALPTENRAGELSEEWFWQEAGGQCPELCDTNKHDCPCCIGTECIE